MWKIKNIRRRKKEIEKKEKKKKQSPPSLYFVPISVFTLQRIAMIKIKGRRASVCPRDSRFLFHENWFLFDQHVFKGFKRKHAQAPLASSWRDPLRILCIRKPPAFEMAR